MVTIVVSNATLVADGETYDQEEFLLPRALVAMQSKYFENVFKGRFAERKTGRSVLDDVSPWVFRCFVGWLFFQKIFYDDARVEPSELGQVEPEDQSQVQEVEDAIPNASAPTFLEVHAAARPSRALQKNLNNAIDVTRNTDRDEDAYDPVTWQWSDLFELYVFGDKYDSRTFRMAVFDAIHFKLLQKRPISYPFPSATDITYISQKVPTTSKLIRLLAAHHQSISPSAISVNFERQAEFLAKFPSAFTAVCYVHAQREVAARVAGKVVARPLPCFYHEHGGDVEELQLCETRWKERISLYR